MIKDIRKYNEEKFLQDLKTVTEIMVFANNTGEFFQIKKKDLKKAACENRIKYYITTNIFMVKRRVMVIQ